MSAHEPIPPRQKIFRVKELNKLGQNCASKLKPFKVVHRRYSEINKKRRQYIYGELDEAP